MHSAGGVAEVSAFAVPAGFAAAAVVFGFAGQTPSTVITAAVAGTDAEVSGAAWGGACICIAFPAGAACAGGGVPGAACPQASVPDKTHNSQLIRIKYFLQDWWFRESKQPRPKS